VAPEYRFSTLLGNLRPCCTAPTFANLCLLLYGWLLTPHHTVCGCLAALGERATKHFSTYHRTLSAAHWSATAVGLAIAGVALRLCPATVCLVAIDDTTTRHVGRRVWGTGYHRDAVRSTPTRKVWCRGHCWVVLSLQVPVPYCARRFALPVLCRLYLNQTTAQKCGQPHRTKPELALELVQALAARFPDQRFHLLVDTNYGGESVLANLPATFDLTSRLMPQTALHQPLELLSRRRPGRPRVRGPRLPSLAACAQRPARRRRVVLYRQAVPVAPVSLRAAPHPVPGRGGGVGGCRPRKPGDKLQAIYTTVLTDRPEAVLERYAARWPIETCCWECKQQLGLESPRCRTRRAVERTTPLAFASYSLTVLWFIAGGYQRWQLRPPPWYPQKRCPAFADLLTLLRAQCRHELWDPCAAAGESTIPPPSPEPAWPWAA